MQIQTDWNDEVGITTSSLTNQITAEGDGEIDIMDLPRIMRDELGMRVIDFNTDTFAALDDAGIHRLREDIDKAGCIVTNLKSTSAASR
jgi:hypothetical protein